SEDRAGGDFIYVNKWVQPDYGDVVVVYAEVSGASGIITRGNLIKRAVAFGGDTVEIKEGVLYRNGEEVDESGYIQPDRNSPLLNNFSAHTVKEGCMFLLGDNRNKSSDSREYGDFPLSSLVGVVPQWSMDCKDFTTSVYTYFNFTILGKN
ncbi:MAG: signal peptidase I, partial [Clostridia bacterium]|nr:signal peptidase I [Clostridia bacterium]